jgi:uncharacterized protein YceK
MKRIVLACMLVLRFTLSACGSSLSQSATQSAATTQANVDVLSPIDGSPNTDNNNVIPTEYQ